MCGNCCCAHILIVGFPEAFIWLVTERTELCLFSNLVRSKRSSFHWSGHNFSFAIKQLIHFFKANTYFFFFYKFLPYFSLLLWWFLLYSVQDTNETGKGQDKHNPYSQSCALCPEDFRSSFSSKRTKATWTAWQRRRSVRKRKAMAASNWAVRNNTWK